MKTKAERITALVASEHSPVRTKAALEAMSDEELAGLETHVEAKAKPVAPVAAPAATTTEVPAVAAAPAPVAPVAEVPKAASAAPVVVPAAAPTDDEWLKTAPARVRDMVSRHETAEAAQKTKLVDALKTAQQVYTEVDLKALAVPELDKMAKMLGIEVNPVIDYGGMGAARVASEGDVYQNPPDGYRIALDKRSGVAAK